MATEIVTSFQQICDANGVPISGAKIYVYDAGTTTPRTLYSDPGLDPSDETDNPIICNSSGRHEDGMVYTATGSYKIVVKTSAGVSVYTLDNIDGRIPVGSVALAIVNGGTGATTANGALAALGAATAAEVADLAAEVAAQAGAQASTAKTHIATGTTAQRDAVPADGDIRRNTTIPQYEVYDGVALAWKKWLNGALVSADFPTGAVVASSSSQYTSAAAITGTTPYDNTIPQVGEGTQIMSLAYAATAAGNKLRIRLSGAVACASAGVVPILHVHVDGAANATAAQGCVIGDNAGEQSFGLVFEYSPGDTSSHTFTVRAGTNGGSTIRFNGNTSIGATLGAAQAGTWLIIEEIKV